METPPQLQRRKLLCCVARQAGGCRELLYLWVLLLIKCKLCSAPGLLSSLEAHPGLLSGDGMERSALPWKSSSFPLCPQGRERCCIGGCC